MKRTKLNKKGKSDISRCKDRIQKLLTQIVRVRDLGCIFSRYPETGKCSGFTAADHINSRVKSISYGDTRNVIEVCQRHHIYWKPQNPLEYTQIVKDYVGEKIWEWLGRIRKDNKTYSFGLWEWQRVELALIQELKELHLLNF